MMKSACIPSLSSILLVLLMFIYSEKATKFCEIFPLLLTVHTVVKSKGKISQNFVAFSEYMNFKLPGCTFLESRKLCYIYSSNIFVKKPTLRKRIFRVINHLKHGLLMPNEAFFHRNPKLLGLGRQFGQTIWADKFWGIFGQFISTHFGKVSPLSMFSINQPLFLQKTKPLYPNPKYLFAIGIWMLAAKNWGFGHHVSVVRAVCYGLWWLVMFCLKSQCGLGREESRRHSHSLESDPK